MTSVHVTLKQKVVPIRMNYLQVGPTWRTNSEWCDELESLSGSRLRLAYVALEMVHKDDCLNAVIYLGLEHDPLDVQELCGGLGKTGKVPWDRRNSK